MVGVGNVVAKGVLFNEESLKEVHIHHALSRTGHERILPLLAVYDVMLKPGDLLRPAAATQAGPARVLVLVTPRMHNDLLEYLRVRVNSHQLLSSAEFRTLVADMVAAVAFAHHHGIVHADIKLENFFVLLVDGHPRVMLGDFGHSGLIGSIPTRVSFGTALSRSPEGFASHAARAAGGEHHPLQPSIDVWALGVATLILVQSKLPFNSSSEAAVQRDHADPNIWGAIWRDVSARDASDLPGILALLRTMLSRDPAVRPAAGVLLAHGQ